MTSNVQGKLLILREYDISDITGFLSETPLKKLKGMYFFEWEAVVEFLPHYIKDKTVREKINDLPAIEFNDKTLNSELEWQRAYVVLTFLGQAYVWMEGDPDKPIKILPQKIAVPWKQVSDHIGVPPVLTYASVVLYNYCLKDESKPFSLDNLQAISTFLDDPGESWFYMVHVHEEFAAAPGLKAIEHAYHAMAEHHHYGLVQDLEKITTVLNEMGAILKKMFEHCKPEFFFKKLRAYLGGSKDNGVIYEGVSPSPLYLRGGSGAQDSAIPAFDIFLGAKHDGNQQKDLEDFKQYMPKGHRKFLDELSAQPLVREYVKSSSNIELIRSYNKAVEALSSFRKMHFGIVHSYIIQFVPTGDDSAQGTGGTNLREFLKTVRENAEKLKIEL